MIIDIKCSGDRVYLQTKIAIYYLSTKTVLKYGINVELYINKRKLRMLQNNQLSAGIYKLNREKDGNHYLTASHLVFEVPGKNYGNLEEDVEIIWADYNRSLGGTGIILSGATGSGKSRLGEVLANKAISLGLPVIYCTEVKTDISTINYLSMMKNAVIFFDEFGKNFDHRLQDKMLSMLASVTGGKKLFIITESVISRINSDILNRTKRIKYHLDYDRVEKDVLIEYCDDHNINDEFFKELYTKYETSTVFSFDNLEGLVSEHLARPTASFDELLRVLNLSALTKPLRVHVRGVTDKVTGKTLSFTFNDSEVTIKDFKGGRRIWIDIKLPVEEKEEDKEPQQPNRGFGGNNFVPSDNVMITNDFITRVDGNLYTINYSDKYEIFIEGR